MNEKGLEILRGIKECVDFVRGNSSSREVQEDNIGIVLLLIRVEDLTRRGLRQKKNTDYFDFFASCLRKDLDFGSLFKKFELIQELKTSIGKGRALLRHVLSLNLLTSFFRVCLDSKTSASWYAPQAYFRDKDFIDKFLSVICEIDAYKFNFEIRLKEIDFSWPFEDLLYRANGKYYLYPEKVNEFRSQSVFNEVENYKAVNESLNSEVPVNQNLQLEIQMSKMQLNCERLELELAKKDEELQKTKDEMDYLRQLTLLLRSSPDGANNTSQSSLEFAGTLDTSSASEKASLKVNDGSGNTWLDEMMEQQKRLNDEVASHALLKQAMDLKQSELEQQIHQLKEELSSIKAIRSPPTDTKSCQSEAVHQVDRETEACDLLNESLMSNNEKEQSCNTSFGPLTWSNGGETTGTLSLTEELEKLAKKYAEARSQIAELQELNEHFESSENGKVGAQKEKFKTMKSENDEIKNRFLLVEKELREKELSYKSMLVENEKMNQEVQKIHNSLKLRDEDISKLQEEKSDLIRENEILQTNLDSSTTDLKALRAKLIALETQLSEIELKFKSQSTENSKLSDVCTDVQEDNMKLRSEVSELRDKLDCTVASSRSQVTAISTERDSIHNLYMDAKRQLIFNDRLHQQALNEKQEQIEMFTRKLLSLTKEKDVMWQQLDRVQEISQSTLIGGWVNENDVKQCALCQITFTLFVRKHHCRSCGNVFCVACSNHFISVAHSNRKERVCTTCSNNRKDARILLSQQKLDSPNLDAMEEQKFNKQVKLSKEKFITGGRFANSVNSLVGLDTSYHSSPPGSIGSLQIRSMHKSATMMPGLTPNMSGSASMLDGNQYGSFIESASRPETPERDTLYNDRSKSVPGLEMPSSDLQNLVNAPLENTVYGPCEKQGQVVLAPGQNRGVPLQVDCSGSTISWTFSSVPKCIQFALLFRENSHVQSDGSWQSPDSDDNANSVFSDNGANSYQRSALKKSSLHVIIPLLTCRSHQEPVNGEILVKTPGTYIIYFDNSRSKYTAKKVEYYVCIN